MAPIPPAAPARSMMRRCLSLTFRAEARMEPKPAPIWAIGPSFPADPPDPMVMAEAMVLITGTRFLTTPFFR